MTAITFSRFETVPAGQDTEQEILKGGRYAGDIVKCHTEINAMSHQRKIDSYTVTLDGTDIEETFWVSDYASARKAHNAAKAFAKANA